MSGNGERSRSNPQKPAVVSNCFLKLEKHESGFASNRVSLRRGELITELRTHRSSLAGNRLGAKYVYRP
jgi:hypothetical protein